MTRCSIRLDHSPPRSRSPDLLPGEPASPASDSISCRREKAYSVPSWDSLSPAESQAVAARGLTSARKKRPRSRSAPRPVAAGVYCAGDPYIALGVAICDATIASQERYRVRAHGLPEPDLLRPEPDNFLHRPQLIGERYSRAGQMLETEIREWADVAGRTLLPPDMRLPKPLDAGASPSATCIPQATMRESYVATLFGGISDFSRHKEMFPALARESGVWKLAAAHEWHRQSLALCRTDAEAMREAYRPPSVEALTEYDAGVPPIFFQAWSATEPVSQWPLAFVAVVHALPDAHPFLAHLSTLGCVAAVIIKRRWRASLDAKQIRYKYPVLDVDRDGLSSRQLVDILTKATRDETHRLCIIDHGGYFANPFQQARNACFEHYTSQFVAAIVETTVNGDQRYRREQCVQDLPFDSVARCEVKEEENEAVARNIRSSTAAGLHEAGESLGTMRTVGVLGFGGLGEPLVKQLIDDDKLQTVLVYDPMAARQIASWGVSDRVRFVHRRTLLAQSDLIFCMTGRDALRSADARILKDGVYIACSTSRDDELRSFLPDQFDVYDQILGLTAEATYTLHGPHKQRIHLLGAGHIINRQPTELSRVEQVQAETLRRLRCLVEKTESKSEPMSVVQENYRLNRRRLEFSMELWHQALDAMTAPDHEALTPQQSTFLHEVEGWTALRIAQEQANIGSGPASRDVSMTCDLMLSSVERHWGRMVESTLDFERRFVPRLTTIWRAHHHKNAGRRSQACLPLLDVMHHITQQRLQDDCLHNELMTFGFDNFWQEGEAITLADLARQPTSSVRKIIDSPQLFSHVVVSRGQTSEMGALRDDIDTTKQLLEQGLLPDAEQLRTTWNLYTAACTRADASGAFAYRGEAQATAGQPSSLHTRRLMPKEALPAQAAS